MIPLLRSETASQLQLPIDITSSNRRGFPAGFWASRVPLVTVATPPEVEEVLEGLKNSKESK